jgi:hypothetical protein
LPPGRTGRTGYSRTRDAIAVPENGGTNPRRIFRPRTARRDPNRLTQVLVRRPANIQAAPHRRLPRSPACRRALLLTAFLAALDHPPRLCPPIQQRRAYLPLRYPATAAILPIIITVEVAALIILLVSTPPVRQLTNVTPSLHHRSRHARQSDVHLVQGCGAANPPLPQFRP